MTTLGEKKMKKYLVVIETTEEGCDYNLHCGTLTMIFEAKSYQDLINKIHVKFADYGPEDYWEFAMYKITEEEIMDWAYLGNESNMQKCHDCYEVGDFKKIGNHYFCELHAEDHDETEEKCNYCGSLTTHLEIVKGKRFCDNCFNKIFGES